jgi:hypothetical protein
VLADALRIGHGPIPPAGDGLIEHDGDLCRILGGKEASVRWWEAEPVYELGEVAAGRKS